MDATITPLHVRSGYSLLAGANSPADIVARAAALGHGRVAMTDVNSLAGATVFHKAAGRAGVEPIIGAELDDGVCRVVALVTDETGYENLCRAITRILSASQPTLPAALEGLAGGLHLVATDTATAVTMAGSGLPHNRLWVGIDPASQSQSDIRSLVESGCVARYRRDSYRVRHDAGRRRPRSAPIACSGPPGSHLR